MIDNNNISIVIYNYYLIYLFSKLVIYYVQLKCFIQIIFLYIFIFIEFK